MTQIFKITPVDKKSVEAFYDVYEELPDGSVRGWTVTETYRWGIGYREHDDPVYNYETDRVRCNTHVGFGAELDDLCACFFEFDDSYTQEERDAIENCWHNGVGDLSGSAWLFEGDHQWQIEDDCIYVIGPVKIDLVSKENYNQVFAENIPPKVPAIPPAGVEWPFSTENK